MFFTVEVIDDYGVDWATNPFTCLIWRRVLVVYILSELLVIRLTKLPNVSVQHHLSDFIIDISQCHVQFAMIKEAIQAHLRNQNEWWVGTK